MTRLSLLSLLLLACAPAKAPPTREVIHLYGSPYQRGLQHGQQLRSKVLSLHATLLTNSLLPYLSREQPDIVSVLPVYGADRYQNGQFGHQLLLDSAKNIEKSLPHAVRDELRGISDGSGLPYDDVLILNTVFDSTLAVRAVSFAIRLSRAPQLESVEFLGADSDGVDNDGDGQVDEPGEGLLSPYAATPYGALVELPPTVRLRAVLSSPRHVDRALVRVELDGVVYTQDSPELALEDLDDQRLQLTLTPAAPLAQGATVTVVLAAGDQLLLDKPPPAHASFMRDEELVFTTKGAGLAARDVRRPPLHDGRTQPPAFAFGVRGSMTPGGAPLLAQHFAMLDANTSHRHTAIFVHHPDSGPAFMTVGWAGVAFGMSGMNEQGLAWACNPADTLNNSVVGSVVASLADLSQAQLLAGGLPVGFAGRKVLETSSTVGEAATLMRSLTYAFGWSCLVADAQGGLEAVEVHSDVFHDGEKGVHAYAPEDLDADGRRLSSVTADDLETGSCRVQNVADISTFTIAGQRVTPEKTWSSFFFRARRGIDATARHLGEQKGTVDVSAAEAILSAPELVDTSDSMNAVVFDLAAKTAHVAMGSEPATASAFEATTFDPEAAQ
jgi:hypothetical protein